jgi:uncharacterized protein YndB with AHSA1/START domain
MIMRTPYAIRPDLVPRLAGSNRVPVESLRVERLFAQAPDRLFDAWLDPERALKWLAAANVDNAEPRVALDARVGGTFSIAWRHDGVESGIIGEYLEIDRPELLVFTLAMARDSVNESRVIVEWFPDRKGCRLMLSHVELPPGEAGRMARAWRTVLDRLAM